MELNKGLWKDGRENKNPLGSWSEAKNILISKGFRSIVNEDGFSTTSTIQGTLIGVIATSMYGIHFIKHRTHNAIYKVLKDTTVIPILSDLSNPNLDLNFNLDFPIEGVFKVNNKKQVIICWTDFNDNIKTLNVDNVPTDLTNNTILLNPYITDNIEYVLNIEEGTGSLQVGNYRVVTRYKATSGVYTNWNRISKPLFITDDILAVGYNNYDGAKTGTITNKAISITLNDIDTDFNIIEVAIIEVIDGVTSAKIISSEDIVGTTKIVKYTGSEIVETIDISAILTPFVRYSKAKTLTQFENNLYIGNLKTDDILDYQKYANNIKIDYVTTLTDVTNFSGSSKVIALNHNAKSFNHREVYSFYIVFVLKGGGYSSAFHIPGRLPVSGAGEKNPSTYDSTMLNYEIYDSADVVGAATNMGFWENKNEKYPSSVDDINGDFEVWDNTGQIGNIQGQNVRHHRFPSLTHVFNSGVHTDPLYRISKADILGINVSDVYIPAEIQDRILGWEVFYAQRDYSECTILGQDFLERAGTHNNGTPETTRYSRGLNYSYIRRTPGTLITPIDGTLKYLNHDLNYLQCRNPDLLKDKPSTTPQVVIQELLYQLSTTRNRSILSAGLYDIEKMSVDLTGNWNVNDTVTISTSGNTIHKVLASQYVAANTILTDLDNRLGDEFIEYEVSDGASLPLSNQYQMDNPVSTVIPLLTETLYSLVKLKQDIYSSFATYPRLVGTGVIFSPSATGSTATIYGGDIFVSDYCSVRYGVSLTDVFEGTRNRDSLHHFLRGILNTVNNWSLRHLDNNDGYTWYYPKKIPTSFPDQGFVNYDKNLPHQTLYNQDFTAINNLNVVFPYNYKNSFLNTFPFRIARTTTANNETNDVDWGVFLANNYKDMPRDKGEIWKIDSLNTVLLINQMYSFFTAVDKDKLGINVEEIFVGSGDVFDRTPNELIPTTLGYAGCQSQWATCISKHGYVFADKQQGKIFLFNGSLIELSNKGLRNFFVENLNYLGDFDNPFIQKGLCCTFDERFNRLIFAKTFYTSLGGVFGQLDVEEIYFPGDIITDGYNIYLVVESKIPGKTYYPIDLIINIDGDILVGYGELISKLDTQYYRNDGFTLSYSFDYNVWVCEHDYNPNYMYYTREGTFSVLNNYNSITYQFNTGSKGMYYDRVNPYRSFVDVPFIIGKEVRLQAIKWKSDAYDRIAKVFIEDSTITHLLIYTKNQCSSEYALISKNPARNSSTLLRNSEGIWSSNNFRDLVVDRTQPFLDDKKQIIVGNLSVNKSFFNRTKFLSDYFIVRFIIDNLSNEEIYLNDVDMAASLTTLTENKNKK
jgi:hypothetical protein